MKKLLGILYTLILSLTLSGCTKTEYIEVETSIPTEIEVPYLDGRVDLIDRVKEMTNLCVDSNLSCPEWDIDDFGFRTLIDAEKEIEVELESNSKYTYVTVGVPITEQELSDRINVLHNYFKNNNVFDGICEVCLDTLKEIPYLTGDETLINRIEILINVLIENNITVPDWIGNGETFNEKGEDVIPTNEVDENGCIVCVTPIYWVVIPISDDELINTIAQMETLLTDNGVTVPE